MRFSGAIGEAGKQLWTPPKLSSVDLRATASEQELTAAYTLCIEHDRRNLSPIGVFNKVKGFAFLLYGNVMTEWLYYGSRELQSDGKTITLPPDLVREEVIPGEDRANIFWFSEDEKVGFSDSLKDTSQLPDLISSIQAVHGARVTTVVKPCRVDDNGDPRFEPKQILHFVATKEMVDGDESSVYVLSTDELLKNVPSSEAWVRTQDNLQRLFDLAEIDRLEKLLPEELTGGRRQTGSGETVSFDSYRYQPGKGGFVEIDNESQDTVVARWFRYEDGMNSAEKESETYSLIESKFEVLDAEDKTLEQLGETEQFTVEYYKDVDDWAKESEDGSLDHVPRAIEKALEDGGWTVRQTKSP